MSKLTKFWAKRAHVSTASRVGGIALFVFALACQILIGYYLVKDTASGFQSQSQVIAEAADDTGLPTELVELYAESVMAADGSVVFASIGHEATVVFPPADNAITWGGSAPELLLQLDGAEYRLRDKDGGGATALAPVDGESEGVPEEPPPAQRKPVDAELAVRPVDWGDSLPRAYDNDPFMTFTITEASDEVLHRRLPARASFELVFAKKNSDNSATFSNVSRKAHANAKEFDLIIGSAAEGDSLAAWSDEIAQSGRSTLDKFGAFVVAELLALGLLAFAFGVYRGGFE